MDYDNSPGRAASQTDTLKEPEQQLKTMQVSNRTAVTTQALWREQCCCVTVLMMLQYNQIDWRIYACTTPVLQLDELSGIRIALGIVEVLAGEGGKMRK